MPLVATRADLPTLFWHKSHEGKCHAPLPQKATPAIETPILPNWGVSTSTQAPTTNRRFKLFGSGKIGKKVSGEVGGIYHGDWPATFCRYW